MRLDPHGIDFEFPFHNSKIELIESLTIEILVNETIFETITVVNNGRKRTGCRVNKAERASGKKERMCVSEMERTLKGDPFTWAFYID